MISVANLLDEAAALCSSLPLPKEVCVTETHVETIQETVVDQQSICDVIETPQQFLAWHAVVAADAQLSEEQSARDHIAHLNAFAHLCDQMAAGLAAVDEQLTSLLCYFRDVETKSQTVQDACERVLDEQNHVASAVEQLRIILCYFTDLESVSSVVLNASGDAKLLSAEFIKTLHRMDECIKFLEQKFNYKDAALYLSKYNQCLIRGMSEIKSFILDALKKAPSSIQLSEATDPNLKHSLLYTKFHRIAQEQRFLIKELEQRSLSNQEVSSMLRECIGSYFIIRQQMLFPLNSVEAQEIMANHKDLTATVRAAVMAIQGLVQKETFLFRAFFHLYDDEFKQYLVGLVDPFYQLVRPLIFKELRIDILADLFEFISAMVPYARSVQRTAYAANQAASQQSGLNISNMAGSLELISTQPSFKLSSSQSLNQLSSMASSSTPHPADSQQQDEQHIQHLCSSALNTILNDIAQDIQQGLMIRAQSYIQQDIVQFKPRDEEILLYARIQPSFSRSSTAINTNNKDSPSGNKSHHRRTSFIQNMRATRSGYMYGGGEWYPTVQKSLLILCTLYTTTSTQVFQDIAQEIFRYCRLSLHHAVAAIMRHQTPLDAHLFLFKHLAYLRNEMQRHFAAFEFVKNETSFDVESVLSRMAMIVTDHKLAINYLSSLGRGLIEAATSPSTVDQNLDSKQMIDEEFRKCHEDIIFDILQKSLEPLLQLRIKCKALQQTPHLISPQHFKDAYDTYLDLLTDRFKPSLHKIYMQTSAISDAAQTLFRYIKSNMVDQYTQFIELVKERHPDVSAQITSPQDMAHQLQAVWDEFSLQT